MRNVYLDYASLTPIDKGVLAVMKKYQKDSYMNPASIYSRGVSAKKILDENRKKVADTIHAHSDEIIFTASGTEANNLALRGIVEKELEKKKPEKIHLIVSDIEHSSIIEIAKAYEKKGIRVSYISVDSHGLINLDEFKKALCLETILVSIMSVNNEIGTIQPIHEIAKIIRNYKKVSGSAYPLFHTDACQAMYLPLYVEKMGIDMMTLDGQKIFGPRAIGMLYVKRGIELVPIIYGGGQEKGLRSGTENVPAIAGFGHAIFLAGCIREKESIRIGELKKLFIEGLRAMHLNIVINAEENSSCHIVNISIPGIDSEFFVLQMDVRGISCSTKSACLHDSDESYVLRAIGKESSNSLRFSFGRSTSKKDIRYALKMIGEMLV